MVQSKFLRLPNLDSDYENRVARTLQMVLYAMFAASIFGTFIAFIDGDITSGRGIIIGGVIVGTAIILMHSGKMKLAAAIVPFLTFGVAAYLTTVASGPRSLVAILYLTTIIMAATLLGRTAAVTYAGLALAAVTAQTILAINGLVVDGQLVEYIDMAHLAEWYIHIIVISVMVWQLVTNLMKALEKSRENEHKLALLNAELEARVEARTAQLAKAKEEAEEARDKALEADRIKSQFLASMSHELRTPLNSILTFSELLAMEAFGPVNEEQKDYLQKTLGSGRHLLALINDVLDITKLNSGMMQMHIEDDLNLSEEINTAVSTAESLLVNKPEVTLVTEIADSLPLVKGDRRRIKQVMINLVSNACKFTEEGTVHIRARQDADAQFLFQVQDTGPGIPADQHAIIFDPFMQTETGIKHAGGTGLGLPISKRLIEEHNGSMTVDSTSGKGATFTFTLPATIKETNHAI